VLRRVQNMSEIVLTQRRLKKSGKPLCRQH
jgi:hypothetical protein